MTGNRIHAMLDSAGVAWREPRAAIAARRPAITCPFSLGRRLLVEPEPPLLPYPLMPLNARVESFHDDDMPPTALEGWVWASPDAAGNLRKLTAVLVAALGPGKAEDSSNAHGFVWRDGRASLRALCFPPALQPRGTTNRWQEREPRLATAASLWLETGWLPPCSPAERAMLAAAEPGFTLSPVTFAEVLANWRHRHPPAPQPGRLARLFGARPAAPPPPAPSGPGAWMALNRVAETNLRYAREPVPEADRLFARAALAQDGATLFLALDALWAVPLAEIESVVLLRAERARGPGYSEIELSCRPPGRQPRRIPVTGRGTPEGADELADSFTRWIGKPLIIEHGLDD